jgi:rhamnulokinase
MPNSHRLIHEYNKVSFSGGPSFIVSSELDFFIKIPLLIKWEIFNFVAQTKEKYSMNKTHFFAVDLGATSGRTILGSLDEEQLKQEEITRFPNEIIHLHGHLYWDILALYNEIIKGLREVARRGIQIDSIGIDTWGVDVALFGKDGHLLRSPYSYRDPYTSGEMERYFNEVPKKKVYETSGIQFMNFNTLFQLSAMHRNGDSAFAAADKILFIPDALIYMLTGQMVTEYTILSTSGMMDPRTQRISPELIAPLGLTEEHFGRYVQPGERIGTLTPEVQQQTGLGAVPVVAVAGHDTASAVAAIPAKDRNYAYLSSGTWSLMGIETPHAIINDESYAMNFTNEGGIEGTTRFLKNICGMWLFEQSRKEWEVPKKSYEEIYVEAEKVEPFRSLINPDDPSFAAPDSMVKAIRDYCRHTDQPVPETIAEQCRCIYDSLALRYREVFRMLQSMAPFPLERLHIIGGGSLNYLLDQYIANSLGIPVYAGPQEATAAGNIMLQAKSLGAVKDIRQMRAIIARSVSPKEYLPTDKALWDEGFRKYTDIVGRAN